MSRRQKREHKKREDVRRQRARRHPLSSPLCGSHIKHGAMALAAAGAIAAGTQAYASPVRFDNLAGAGHFEWLSPSGQFTELDIVRAADDQPGSATSSSFGQINWFDELSRIYGSVEIVTHPVYGARLLSPLDAGAQIPSGLAFHGYGNIQSSYPGLLPEGDPTYLGVRFDLGSGNQYGWFGVVRTGYDLDAFAWGYETDIGVSVAAGAPEPGSLALLAFGAAALAKRRRR